MYFNKFFTILNVSKPKIFNIQFLKRKLRLCVVTGDKLKEMHALEQYLFNDNTCFNLNKNKHVLQLNKNEIIQTQKPTLNTLSYYNLFRLVYT